MPSRLFSQCIAAFPNTETFETDNGGWTTGGIASDWTWGAPAKPVIRSAGSGTRCWITGGLSRSAYNDGENAWVMSKCYDFSTLINPQVSFKIFWEIERRFDGAALEYSTDGGASWTQLGSQNSNANCDGVNWYNFSPILYLGNTSGWSGNIQSTSGSCQGGSGSGAWLTAMHKVGFLAGQSNVLFRFVFAAGTQCNAYDGFAFDDFDIRETPANPATFTYTCNPARNVSFFSTPTFCQQNITWDFDDPASGSSNTSSQQNPVHVFSAPGTYVVKFSVQTTNNPTIAFSTQTITIAEAIPSINNLQCAGDANGSISLQMNPPGTYQYTWNTTPVQTTPAISNLVAGTYTVTITSAIACTIIQPVTVTEPQAIAVSPNNISAAICNSSNGSITISVNGGISPYTYTWSNGESTAGITGLSAGDYSLQVSDANGCNSAAMIFTVPQVNNAVFVSLTQSKSICPGDSLILTPVPSNFQTYVWQDNSNAPTFVVKSTGLYAVTVTDASGCTGNASIRIVVDCNEIYFPSAFTPGEDDTRNVTFGALGTNLGAVSQFNLQVYNRAGQIIFSTKNAFEKWDGTFKGKKLDSQVFIWQANFTYNGRQYFEKGTLILIR